MGKKDIKILKKVDNLFLDIYIIGYKTEGESILFLLKTLNDDSEESILYKAVIDSYELRGKNQTIKLLESLNIKTPALNLLCWTHPDRDHSKGIDNLLKECADIDTRVIVPPSMLNLRDKLTITAKKFCDAFVDTIYDKNWNERYNIINAVPGLPLQSVEVESKLRRKPYKLTIKSISPYAKLIDAMGRAKNLTPNDFSIAMLLEIEGINILFSSDIQHDTIEYINEEIGFPKKLNFIKIPHHTSIHSKNILNYLNATSKAEIACTTVYKRIAKDKKMPNKDLLKDYGIYCKNIFCTDPEIMSSKSNSNFGILKANIDVINKKITYDCLYDATEVDVTKL